MPETLAVTMALDLHGYKRVALITDGRFSGASAGQCVGHVSPKPRGRADRGVGTGTRSPSTSRAARWTCG